MIRDFELDAIIGESHPEFPNGDIATLNKNLKNICKVCLFHFLTILLPPRPQW